MHNVAEDGHDRALVRTILAMGDSLGLDVVAEGVETVQQLDVLTQLGCTHVQGYLISRPVQAHAMRGTLSALVDTQRDIPVMRRRAADLLVDQRLDERAVSG